MADPATHSVVGTAGHIDHGKTALVRALTGIDTDRLPEEKARGITIDIGFAYLEEPDGLMIEIVDVPGHERFVKNMLAGVGGIDLAMLVVAADEGVMPQTREHLAICSLLHIKSGLCVLTKRDLAEADWIELVRDDLAALVRGTFLEGAPIVAASAKTGDGPLELLGDAPRPLKARDRVRFHTGTSEIMARVLLLDRAELAPGESTYARFRLERRLVALPGDRFVLRSYSPIVTIGGGTLLDVSPPRFKRKAPALLAHLGLLERGSEAEVLEEHVRHAGASGLRLDALSGRVPFGLERLRALLEDRLAGGALLAVDRDWFLHRETRERLRADALRVLEDFHRRNPLKSGISREELRGRAGQADERVFGHLLAVLEAEGVVRSEKDKVRLASHSLQLSPEQQKVVDGIEAEFRRAGAAPPTPEDTESELFQLLVADRRLIRVKEGLYFHADALRQIEGKLVALLREKKEIGPADIKDLLGISRKYAIPLLEYFDAQRVTQRVGERRVLRGG